MWQHKPQGGQKVKRSKQNFQAKQDSSSGTGKTVSKARILLTGYETIRRSWYLVKKTLKIM